MQITRLSTVILLILSVCCGIQSFPQVGDFAFEKKKPKEMKSTNCYDDCNDDKGLYKGIRSMDEYKKTCGRWKDSTKYTDKKYTGKGNRCWNEKAGDKIWCAKEKTDYFYCEIPECDDYKRSHCVGSVNISSTSDSITGRYNRKPLINANIDAAILLFDSSTDECIFVMITPQMLNRKNINIRSFVESCKTTLDPPTNDFTFNNLKPDTTYDIYIVPFDSKSNDHKVSYFSHKTKETKLSRILSISAEPSSSSSVNISWKAPEKGSVTMYKLNIRPNDKNETNYTTKDQSYIFDNLNGCTEYCVTVTPTNDNESPEGTMICPTKLAKKPDTVKVTVQPVSSSSINVSWNEIIYFKSKLKYKVDLTVNYDTTLSQDAKENKSVIFNNLTECTKYFVRVTAIAKCTTSLSGFFWETTFARRKGNISLGKIQNGPHLSRNISWSHTWSPKCIAYYIVIFYIQDNIVDSREEHHTNKTLFNMVDLFSNEQYEIQVKAVLPRTENGELRIASNVHSFYTGGITKTISLIVFVCVLVIFILLCVSINVVIWLEQNRR